MTKKTWRDYKKTAAAVCTCYGKDGIYLRAIDITDGGINMEITKDEAIRLQESFARKKKLKLVKRYEVMYGENQGTAVLKQIFTDALSGEFKVLIVDCAEQKFH